MLAAFTPAWESLSAAERLRMVQLLIRQVAYHGETGELAVSFHPAGIKTLEAEAGA